MRGTYEIEMKTNYPLSTGSAKQKENAKMKNMLIVMMLAGLLLGGAATTEVNAEVRYFITTSGNWSTGGWNNISCGGGANALPPTEDDVAIICANNTCTVDIDPEVISIDVQTGASLIIPSARTLTLNGGVPGNITSTIDGTVELTGEIDVDLTAAQSEHTFAGGGEIVGQQSSAKILIAGPNRDLISSITIRGALEIGKLLGTSPTFRTAGGLIHADTNGTIKISTQGLFDDPTASATLYKVSHPNAILQFSMVCDGAPCPAICLSKANFELIEGTIKVDAPDGLVTRGTVTAEPGTVFDIETGATFSRLGSCPE